VVLEGGQEGARETYVALAGSSFRRLERLMYRITAYQAFGTWIIGFSRTRTSEERAAGLEPWVERAVVPAKEGRDEDLDAMQSICVALDLWFRMAAERTP
jgi:hypothetical protein